MDFNAYTIENIWESPMKDSMFYLHFMMNGFEYKIGVVLYEKGYLPGTVAHEKLEYPKLCPLCHSSVRMCNELMGNNEVLLDYFINHPTVRLRWLMKNQFPKTKNS